MAQLIPTVPGIGASLGTGISSGLSALAEAKIKQMVEGPQNAAFSQLIGSLYPQQGQNQAQPNTEGVSNGQEVSGGQGRINPGQLTQEQAEELAKKLSPAQQQQFFHLRSEALKQNLEQEKFGETKKYHEDTLKLKKQAQIDKRVGPELDTLRRAGHQAEKDYVSLSQALKILESGNPITGPQQALLLKAGLSDVFTNADTQMLKQIRDEVAQGAGPAYEVGGNLTNQEVGNYKNQMLSLVGDRAGTITRIKNKLLEIDTIRAKTKARRDIIKENGGVPPDDIMEQIADRTNEIARKNFDQGMKNLEEFLSGKSGNSQQEASSTPGKQTTSLDSSEASSGEGRNILQRATDKLEGGALGAGARLVERGLGAVGDLLGPAQNILSEATGLPKLIPGREEFREAGKKLFGDFFEPKGKGEEFVSNVLEDAVSFVLPGAGQVGIFKALAKSLAGESASKLTESLGGGPLAQSAAKLGVSLLAGTAGTRAKLVDADKKAYTIATKLAEGKEASGKIANKTASKIFDEVKGTPVGEFVKKRAQEVIDATTGEKNPLQQIWDTKRNLGKWFNAKETPTDAIPYLKRLIGGLNESLQKSGHKKFLDAFNAAEDIHTGLNAQSSVSKFLGNILSPHTLKNPFMGILTGLVTGGSIYHAGLPGAALVGAGAAGVAGARELTKTIDLISKSQVAANAYTDIIKYSLARDATNAARAVNRYIKIAEKNDKD